jgi:hypothetical protein
MLVCAAGLEIATSAGSEALVAPGFYAEVRLIAGDKMLMAPELDEEFPGPLGLQSLSIIGESVYRERELGPANWGISAAGSPVESTSRFR